MGGSQHSAFGPRASLECVCPRAFSVRATWACSASTPSGQTLRPARPHTHQQGHGRLGGERRRLSPRSPASCARSCRPPRHAHPAATPEMGKIPQKRPGRFQPPERGSRSSALLLSSAGWLWGASPCALHCLAAGRGGAPGKDSGAGPSPFGVGGGVGRSPGGGGVSCAVIQASLCMPVLGHASMEDMRNPSLFTKY